MNGGKRFSGLAFVMCLLSLITVTGCNPSGSQIKEEAFTRMRADYLALKNSRDQQAIEAFDRFFDAERFRHEYWIHLASGRSNSFWWGSVQDSPEFGRYTVYMIPLDAIPLDKDSVYHIRPYLPVTKESVTAALQEGYASLDASASITELKGSPAVIASREGKAGEDGLFMTLIVDLHGKFFAIAVMTQREFRGEVIKHLIGLLNTAK